MPSLEEQYKALRPAFDRCAAEGREILVTLVGQLTCSHLIRGQVSEVRVKSLTSIEHKAVREGWSEQDAFERLTDAVGFRIVCNNTEDASRIRDAITSSPRFDHQQTQDFVDTPQASGYRALHVDAIYEIAGKPLIRVPCEIQIRTMVQDAWARLAHHDLFKNRDNVPDHILKLSGRLAEILAVADEIAQDIREDVSKPLVGVQSEDEDPTPQSLAFIFERAFSRLAPEYVINAALRDCHELGCHRLDLLERTVMDDELRNSVGSAYREMTKWDMHEETWFLLAINSAVYGPASTIDRAKQQGREERDEVEAIAKRDMLYYPPESLDELKGVFVGDRDGILDYDQVYELARHFNALRDCSLCGAPIVEVDSLVENALDFLEIDEDLDGELSRLIIDSGVEIGDWGGSGLCSYDAYVMSKDD